MNQQEINEAAWLNDANWKYGVYSSAQDTRVWVPKRPRWMGWTLNFAHRAAVFWLLALITPGILVAIIAISVAAR